MTSLRSKKILDLVQGIGVVKNTSPEEHDANEVLTDIVKDITPDAHLTKALTGTVEDLAPVDHVNEVTTDVVQENSASLDVVVNMHCIMNLLYLKMLFF